MARKHKDELDLARLRVDVKLRWSDEELLMMARKEIELTEHGNIRNINQRLAEAFAPRTVDAIKKCRQRDNYKSKIEQLRGQAALIPIPNVEVAIVRPSESEQDRQVSIPSTVRVNPLERSNSEILRRLQGLGPVECARRWKVDVLQTIIDRAHTLGKSGTLQCLSNYLREIFPVQNRVRTVLSRRSPNRPRNRRQLRRQQYARVQRNWDKHKSRCIKSLLDGPDESVMPNQEIMAPYWREVMTHPNPSNLTSTVVVPMNHLLEGVWDSITPAELKKFSVSLTSSPGPDGITPRVAKSVPSGVMVRIMNLILWCGNIPKAVRPARTIFIPKTVRASLPQDFRPISVPSVLVRQLHAILASRLNSRIQWDPRQRGFLPTDGCADNTTMVDLILRDHHKRHASCYIATLDVSKAFDSVSHAAIITILKSYGVPDELVNYVRTLYKEGSTTLNGVDWCSEEFVPAHGVKQGDPLSPILFNLVIDQLLRTLPREIGVKVGSAMTNAAAFADDLVLFASTPKGLQKLLDTTVDFLSTVGLTLNANKCFTVSIKGQPKQKCTVVVPQTFCVGSRTCPALKRSEEWKYLGIHFTADGRTRYYPSEALKPKLESISKSPLKPQQKLFALRTVLMPQLNHQLTLGSVSIGVLRKCDKLIRFYIRRWLDLPMDVPVAFFHAPHSHGGLGIPSVRYAAPMLRVRRLSNINWPHLEQSGVANAFISAELERARGRCQAEGNELSSRAIINSYWANRLYMSVDGSGLREASHFGPQHGWVSQPTRLLTGKDYLNGIKLRINALPTRSRTTRGRHELGRRCRAGCDAPETTNHILQKCYRTHGRRVARHNSIVKFIKGNLETRGYVVHAEPSLQGDSGLNKPDLVALRHGHAYVIDAQIVTDGHALDQAHQRKVEKYDQRDIKEAVRRDFQVEGNVEVVSATLNWRGIWSGQSVKRLIALGILNASDSNIMSARTVTGGISCYRAFMFYSGYSRFRQYENG